ncbi:hypothetical protein HPB48_017160 [Haemaphysalis longicornis]|uniref:EGF-like domain-containing protein n=1 Tax=Haemaphysalis longicornis TaxID=44386 RepID=A0A9J6GNJ2_HAELO|nr:hypothetical protein HPB48_017160 [Haemaphysalis longicornis]
MRPLRRLIVPPADRLESGATVTPDAFRREHRTRRPLVDRFRSMGASEWFLDLASRVLDIPERWIQRRTDDRRFPELGSLVRRFTLQEFLTVGSLWHHRRLPGLELDYRVLCADGYAGSNCSERCPSPAEKGARFRCLEGSGGAKQCMEGWRGAECEQPVCAEGCDPEHGVLRAAGRVPVPHGLGSCRFGWQGAKCDECKPLPGCLHGHCTKPLECICEPGWTGIFCHIPVCSPKCHAEHGYCARPNECRCRVGWMGENCSQCCPYPGCRHGSCGKPWECACEPGWGGMLCDKPLSACESQKSPPPCAEGATCVDLPDGGFKCLCPLLIPRGPTPRDQQ